MSNGADLEAEAWTLALTLTFVGWLCRLFSLLLWQNVWHKSLKQGRVYLGTYFEAALHHEGVGTEARAALAVGQEHEASGHSVSVVRKQGEMDAGVSWLSSFCSVRAPSPANRVVHIQDKWHSNVGPQSPHKT